MIKEKLPNDKIYRYKVDGRFTDDLPGVTAYVMRDYSIGMHIQDFFEINIVTRGYGMHYIGEGCAAASVGDVFIIPPHVRHGYTGGKGFDVSHFIVSDGFIKHNFDILQRIPHFFTLFNAEPLMRAQSEDGALHLKLENERFSKLLPYLYEMYANHKDMRLYYWDKISECREISTLAIAKNIGLALYVITQLCEAYGEYTNKVSKATESRDANFMNTISLIHEKYSEKISLAELAKTARLSRSAFIKRFKTITGMTPSDYIIKQRLDAAENMLINTGYSVADIAFKSGFYDSSHFSRSFSKSRGISPSEYREKIKK